MVLDALTASKSSTVEWGEPLHSDRFPFDTSLTIALPHTENRPQRHRVRCGLLSNPMPQKIEFSVISIRRMEFLRSTRLSAEVRWSGVSRILVQTLQLTLTSAQADATRIRG